eukprot:1156645-Pelagomonas_calceolata.AAC.2
MQHIQAGEAAVAGAVEHESSIGKLRPEEEKQAYSCRRWLSLSLSLSHTHTQRHEEMEKGMAFEC